MLLPHNGKKGTLKQNIIQILSQQRLLGAKKIYNIIKKDRAVSYQAVHKTLKELVQEKVIEKDNKHYQLALEWINSTKTFISQLEDYYGKKENKANSIENNIENASCKSE